MAHSSSKTPLPPVAPQYHFEDAEGYSYFCPPKPYRTLGKLYSLVAPRIRFGRAEGWRYFTIQKALRPTIAGR